MVAAEMGVDNGRFGFERSLQQFLRTRDEEQR